MYDDWTPERVDTERLMAGMARFLIEGNEQEEAGMLLSCELETRAVLKRNDLGPDFRVLVFRFSGPREVYEALAEDSPRTVRPAFEEAVDAVFPSSEFDRWLIERAMALAQPQPGWRDELSAVLEGRDVDNQAIGFKATRTYEGLRFRSESEVRIAEALDKAGVMFLPNCKARVGPTDIRRNSEADFLVMVDGKWGVLEVDGSHWHTGTAARDHAKDRAFEFHGAKTTQRYDAGECFEKPDAVVKQFLALLRSK